MDYSPSIQKLINLFSKFPTVGPRTASRFVFYLLKLSGEEVENLATTISNLKSTVRICKSCFNPFDGEGNLCSICSSANRNKSLLCIVERESDLVSIEKIKKYNGLYFVLGGTVSTLKKNDLEKLRIKELIKLLKLRAEIQEIIIATNATSEGESTALYLERILKPYNKKTTRLGRGLPVGGELEYADERTLTSAFESRK